MKKSQQVDIESKNSDKIFAKKKFFVNVSIFCATLIYLREKMIWSTKLDGRLLLLHKLLALSW